MPDGVGADTEWHSNDSSIGSAVAGDPVWADEAQQRFAGSDRLSLRMVCRVDAETMLSPGEEPG